MNRRNFMKNLPSIGAALALPCVANAEPVAQEFYESAHKGLVFPYRDAPTIVIPEGATLTVYKGGMLGYSNANLRIDGVLRFER